MIVAVALSLFALAAAVPTPELVSRAITYKCVTPYGSFQTDCATMANSVTCPTGFTGAKNGVVLLVHGTGSTGPESWQDGPYVQQLPKGAAVDVCFITLPGRSLVDAQISAEYVAYNIPVLAGKSKTTKMAIIGHSQGGGINPQWALLYWPATRAFVSDYIALAGDFHGTIEGTLLCTASDLTNGCNPSVIQQSIPSNYLYAQNRRGNKALVTTTSIWTLTDDVIQPEIITPTSALPGSAQFPLQDITVCGPTLVADHFSMVINPAAYAIAVDALTHAGPASLLRFDRSSCYAGQLAQAQYIPALLRGALADGVAVGTSPPRTKVEPPLMPYVCAAGDNPPGVVCAN